MRIDDFDYELPEKLISQYPTECRDLLEHDVDGIHFYTLNKSHATREIYASLGIRDSSAVRTA